MTQRLLRLLCSVSLLSTGAVEGENPFAVAEVKHRQMVEQAEVDYRKEFAEALKQGDRVELFIVKFDGLVADPDDPESSDGLDKPSFIRASQNAGAYTPVLKKRRLNDDDARSVLDSLANAVGKEEVGGGALCHYPIHGVRVFLKDSVVYEGTFCWVCSNFGFSMPEGDFRWLDTNEGMEKLFKRLLPIPEEELERAGKMLSR